MVGGKRTKKVLSEVIADLDENLLLAYKKKIGAEGLETKQVLKARGFIKK